jgi:tetratricopeptide (TPR) repeat protein
MAVGPVAVSAVSAAPASERPPAASSPVQVRIGATDQFTRIEFSGRLGARAQVAQDGRLIRIRLPKGSEPDIARLRVDPPKGVAGVDTRVSAAGFDIMITLEPGAEGRMGRADGAVFVNLYAARPEGAAPAKAAAVAAPVVKVEAESHGPALTLRFPWSQPQGSAVFRRGDAVWVVFDSKAVLDLSQTPKSLGAVKRVRWAAGPDFTVVRIEAPQDAAIAASAEGSTWSVTLGGPRGEPQGGVKIGRDDQTGPPALTAALAGATRVIWVTDPVVGDRFAAVTALAPAKPLDRARSFVEASLLPTVHGLAVEAVASDLQVGIEGDLVRVSRPDGLSLSPPLAQARGPATVETLPQPAALPGLIDRENWARTGEEGFLGRYRELQDLAAAEGAKGEDSPVAARMGLARFLVGSGLGYEAIGVLDMTARQHPNLLNDPEFRGLRGGAKAMVGRYKEAQADLSAPVVAGDPSCALWLGYVEARLGNWAEAKREFSAGARAVDLFPAEWKARFATANAQAALELKDVVSARSLIAFAHAQEGLEPYDQLSLSLVEARMLEADGQADRALRVYEAVGRAPFGALSTPAQLRAAKIRFDKGLDKPVQTVRLLDSLRFRWRGDATEMEVIRTLGEIYISQGRYREALNALRSAGKRQQDLPAAVALQADLSAAFRALFLDGQADGLEPIQALALFSDFRELTPVGAEGDEMVRRMARRLIDVDLLPQAAELLKYQVDNRLDGVAKSQVATDLAAVYLMDRRPEQALQALWSSRTTLLPTALQSERRVLEARALADLNRFDAALEILGKDGTPAAQDVRGDVYWRQKAWTNAAALYEKRLGDRWKTPKTPLSGEEETRLIRAGVAMTLAADAKGLQRLAERWSPFIDQARAPDALRIAIAGLDGEGVTPADFARITAQADTFAGWVAGAKKRFRDGAAQVVRTAAAAAKPAA